MSGNCFYSGETSPPTNLTLTLLPQHQGILLTWIPGFSLDGEEVTFIIISHNLASDEQMQFSVNTTSYTLIPPSESSICPAFNVTVYSENRFSRSISGVSEVTLIPGGQCCQLMPLRESSNSNERRQGTKNTEVSYTSSVYLFCQ